MSNPSDVPGAPTLVLVSELLVLRFGVVIHTSVQRSR